jgi:hypothetical protein
MADSPDTCTELPHDRRRSTIRVVAALLGSLAYATLRYNVFKGVPWSQWPVYVVNKAFALGALILVVWVLVLRVRKRPSDDSLRTWTTGCMIAHVALSLAILTPAYYPKYFDGATFTTAAGSSWLLGTAAAAWLFLRLRRCEPGPGQDGLGLGLVGLVVGIHAAVLGFAGWFQPGTWPGHMVPITLISFLLGVAALILGMISRSVPEPFDRSPAG